MPRTSAPTSSIADLRPADRIAVDVIVMPVGVDDSPDGLSVGRLMSARSARRPGRDGAVDQDDIIRVDDHDQIGAEEGITAEGKGGAVEFGRGVIDPIGDLLEL